MRKMTKVKTPKGDYIVEAVLPNGTIHRFFYYKVTQNTALLRTKRVQSSQLRREGFTRKARKLITIDIRPIRVEKVYGKSVNDITGWYSKDK